MSRKIHDVSGNWVALVIRVAWPQLPRGNSDTTRASLQISIVRAVDGKDWKGENDIFHYGTNGRLLIKPESMRAVNLATPALADAINFPSAL